METSNDGVRLHWDEQGSGTPLLLIMGHCFSSDMWWPVIPALAERHRVIWFDNRGSGRSDTPRRDTSVADLADDARAVLDAAGVATAHVFGVSMGGGVALQLAKDHPQRVRSLVLGCTGLESGHRDLPEPSGLRYRIPRRLLRPVFRKHMYGPVCPPDRVDHDLDVLVSSPFHWRGGLLQANAMRTYDITEETAATITAPSLVLHGTADMTVPVAEGKRLADALPRAEFETYEGAGHNFIVACTDAVNARTLQFLHHVETSEVSA